MTAPAQPCAYTPLFGGPRLGPTVGDPSYELVLHGENRLAGARWDVLTWPDRVHMAAVAAAVPA